VLGEESSLHVMRDIFRQSFYIFYGVFITERSRFALKH